MFNLRSQVWARFHYGGLFRPPLDVMLINGLTYVICEFSILVGEIVLNEPHGLLVPAREGEANKERYPKLPFP